MTPESDGSEVILSFSPVPPKATTFRTRKKVMFDCEEGSRYEAWKDRQGAIRSLVQERIRNDPGKKAFAAGKEIGEGLLEIAGVPGI